MENNKAKFKEAERTKELYISEVITKTIQSIYIQNLGYQQTRESKGTLNEKPFQVYNIIYLPSTRLPYDLHNTYISLKPILFTQYRVRK